VWSPESAPSGLAEIAAETNTDELILETQAYDYAARFRARTRAASRLVLVCEPEGVGMGFDDSLDFKAIDSRARTDLRRIGKGEQGVLAVEQNKADLPTGGSSRPTPPASRWRSVSRKGAGPTAARHNRHE
jgi:hypothetical protein